MSITDEQFKGECFVCGEHADAFWMADPSVYVCSTCAIEKLPLLIADAVVGRLKLADGSMIEGTADRMLGAFWRGVALQLLKQKRAPKN